MRGDVKTDKILTNRELLMFKMGCLKGKIKMREWNNLKVLHGCLTVFSVASIIGISFGFAKYYGVPVILDRSICAWDSAILVFSATYLGLKVKFGQKFELLIESQVCASTKIK